MADTSTPIAPTPGSTYTSTKAAYARWASTYDTDGNVLQALDDAHLARLLPAFLTLALYLSPHPASIPQPTTTSPPHPAPLRVIDLGCGTGRNTAKLLSLLAGHAPGAHVHGLDASREMLELARARCGAAVGVGVDASTGAAPGAVPANSSNVRVTFQEWDLLAATAGSGDGSVSAAADAPDPGDALISTLVLEHIPLMAFFATVAALLRPGGLALVTNMHPEMGADSQAGFRDGATGEKVRGVSYCHEIDDVLRVAGENGLEVVDVGLGDDGGQGEEERWKGVREGRVAEEMVGEGEGRLGSRARKWAGRRIWFGVAFRKVK